MSYFQEPAPEPAVPPRTGFSQRYVLSIAAIAIALGFVMGVVWSDSIVDVVSPSAPLFDEDLVSSLFERSGPAVVEIQVSRGRGLSRQQGAGVGFGSGFLIDSDGYIVTNNHVVEGADRITVTLHDERTIDVELLGRSSADDLALLKADAADVAGIEPLTLGDSSEVKTGEIAIAIGSPFRQFNSISVGVVSGTGRGPTSILRRPIPDMIQTDAPLNPGNSGGPLLNSAGEVIGVTSSVSTGVAQGRGEYRIGFAVPSNTLKDLMPELLVAQLVKRPWLGISGGPVTRDLRESRGLPDGIYVTRVFSDSPAEQVGLVPFQSGTGIGRGDVITAVDGQSVGSVEDMVSYFNRRKPGAVVTLSVYRNQQSIDVDVELAEWPGT
jgi:S1-C subfamily serine protease